MDNNSGIPAYSAIRVGGVTGKVARIRVTLHGLSHTWPDDLDILLLAPSQVEGIYLMSDTGGGTDVVQATLTFDDDAPTSLPDNAPITNGVYRATNFESDILGGNLATNLAGLIPAGVNGEWRLILLDDVADDAGSLEGWELEFDWFMDTPGHYADVAGADPAWPHISPAHAANTIQEAVDAAEDGDSVWVAPGSYESGGRPADGFALTNRVLVAKALRVESTQGPFLTTIRGAGPEGNSAVRGVWLGEGASLVGFTVTGGHTRADFTQPDGSGGGVYCAHPDAMVSRCRLVDNHADSNGGNVSGGRIANSLLAEGTAFAGGGASFFFVDGRLDNCTVAGNFAVQGDGVYDGEVRNSLFSGHTDEDVAFCTPTFSCGPFLPVATGNIVASPIFVNAAAGDYSLHPSSPGLEAGDSATAVGHIDLPGNPRIVGTVADMGAFEYIGFTVDGDVDGASDYDEYVAGTNAADSNSVFRVGPVSHNGVLSSMDIPVIAGRSYLIEGSTNLIPPVVWTPQGGFTAGADSVFTFQFGSADPLRFQRVRVSLAPFP